MLASLALLQVREDVIAIEVIGLGSIMLIIITLIHGAGLDSIVSHYNKRAEILRKKCRHPQVAAIFFASSILLMLFLHMAEISLWGMALRMLGLIPNYREAVYFSANTYTTLGMGAMALPHSWRELSPIIAMAGLFTFAWTTGEMFNIVGYQRDLVAELRDKHQRRNEQ
jgi:hypothetical protein